MPRRSHPLQHYIFLSLLLISLALCLWAGQGSAADQSVDQSVDRTINPAPSSPHPTTLVQQGVDRYRSGNIRDAIAPWLMALEHYQFSGHLANQGIVLENLARAYRSLGHTDEALLYWDQALQVQQQLCDGQTCDRAKVGRLLTEQAQSYIRLGQYQQAMVQLCGMGDGVVSDGVVSDGVASNGAVNDGVSCRGGSAVAIAREEGDSIGEAAALGSLGELWRLQGYYDRAEQMVIGSLAIAEDLDQDPYRMAATHSLGNIYQQQARISDRRARDARQRGDSDDADRLSQAASHENELALNYFEQSLAIADAGNYQNGQVQALVSLVPVYHRSGNLASTQSAYQAAIPLVNQLADSRDKAFATIDLANLYPLTQSLNAVRRVLSGAGCGEASSLGEATIPETTISEAAIAETTVPETAVPETTMVESLLKQAIAIAERIEDYRAQSFALGKLGYVYECRQDDDNGLMLTKQAEWAADQALTAPDSLYLWQWQRGRILKRQGKTTEAIDAYEDAIATLEKIRSDILVADRDIQFDFRDTVEPIYRQLAILRLNQAPSSKIVMPEEQESGDIGAALTAIDSLKLAELQNYFGNDCLIVPAVGPEERPQALLPSAANTGVFSTFIADHRTAVILTLPNGEQRVEWLEVEPDDLNDTINQFRLQLETSLYSLQGYNPSAGQPLYDQLIRPFLPDLDQAHIKTLVFVQDGPFRSVPMAALHDGDRYLIEQYAIATTPSLSLTPVEPPSKRDNLRALALGLSQRTTVNGRDWAALNGVKQELDQIVQHLPGSRRLLNADFTRDRLHQELQANAYSILHVATHGEFGAEPEDTFLVTGDGQTLTIGELDAAIRQAGGTRDIDLLILTACKTAIGDNRSALGLAGVAIQAGARSAIASLWSINDTSTAQIMDEFYQQISDATLTKAEALQSAQLTLLQRGGKLARPGFWAPFILIGDWR